MSRLVAFVKKWLLVPLLPFFALWVSARLEQWTLGQSIATMLRESPTEEYVTDVNRTLAATILAISLLFYESLASLLDDARKVGVKTGFQPTNGFADRTYIGRLQEDSTLIDLVVETDCPSRTVRWLLRMLVPDLAIELSWMKDWLRITTDAPTPLSFVKQPDFDGCRIRLFDILGQQGKGKEEFPLYVAPTSNRKKEGQLSCVLASQHRAGFFLANLALLRVTQRPIQLYLRPAIPLPDPGFGQPVTKSDPDQAEPLARIASADKPRDPGPGP